MLYNSLPKPHLAVEQRSPVLSPTRPAIQEAEEPGTESRLRNLPPADLLTQLPVMQRLMDRLIDCLPRGAAARDWVVQMALLTVAKESFQAR